MASEMSGLGPDEREAVGEVSSLWWIWLLLGIGWMIVALIILETDETSVTTVGVIIGIMFIVAGVQEFLLERTVELHGWVLSCAAARVLVSSAASRRRARNSSSLTLPARSPSDSAISLCDDPWA